MGWQADDPLATDDAQCMTIHSIIVFRRGATPPDVSRPDIINIQAPWDLVEGLSRLSLARYPAADRVIAVDEDGRTKGEWLAEPLPTSSAPSSGPSST